MVRYLYLLTAIVYFLFFHAINVVVCCTFSQQQYSVSESTLEINKISFKGNETFDKNTLKEIILSKETPSAFSQFVYRTLGEKLGSKPEYFDPVIFAEDNLRMKDYYQNNGFYETSISNELFVDSSRHCVDLVFSIREGRRSYIDSVTYLGLENVPPDVHSKIMIDPIVQRGMPYQSNKANVEITRVLDILANSGYPAAHFDSAKSGAFKFLSHNNFLLKFTFVTGKPFKFGEIKVNINPPREDITDHLSLRQLDFEPGEKYDREKLVSSERNLNRLGIFESARIDHPKVMDTTVLDAVPIEIYARPRIRNELSPELIVSDEGGFFNLGVGLGYVNRNFFGDARIFNANTRIRTQDIHRWNFKDVFHGKGLRDLSVRGAVELQFQIMQPYFFTRTLSGSWISTISAEKQEIFVLSILKNKVGLSKQFAAYTYGFFDWTLERVSPEILQDTVAALVLLSALRQEEQRQFNSIFTITLQRDKTNDIFSPTDGFFNSISIEESGILPKLLNINRAELPFTQYYKVTLLGRWYRDLTDWRFNILAWKLKSGYQNKYGESKNSSVSIPLNRRFFAGGSGSVRGWNARELGAMPNELIQLGGNFIFEGSIEMRVSHFRGFGKLWFLRLENILGVYFVDFGNTWGDIMDFKPKDIAIAAGLGLRYDTFFGPFRIDFGFRVYDPKADEGKQMIFQKRFWGETISNGVIHFGIGHAF